jgi:RNA ligase
MRTTLQNTTKEIEVKMIHVSNIFPVDDLEEEIAAGNVRMQSHPTLPLNIYNYTEKTQFDRRWNKVTLNCRGLILDDKMNIVARPWEKFFNWGERPTLFSTGDPVEVTDKKDGSLGILYPSDYWHYAIATRGSFSSDQAIHATKIWNDKYAEVEPLGGYTFLFEIVYPENRIVLNYGDMDDLILLGAVDMRRGFYYGPTEAAGMLGWIGPVTEVFEYKTMNECFGVHRLNAEGMVIRSGSNMVKLKQEDYVSLHKLITGLNKRAVWERLKGGASLVDICENLPDEFHDWVKLVGGELLDLQLKIDIEVLNTYVDLIHSLPDGFSRKQFAVAAKETKYPGYMFSLFDGQRIDDKIWDSIRPPAEM